MADKIPSTEELQTLLANIQNATTSYNPDDGPMGSHMERSAIRAAAMQLFNAMSTPHDQVWQRVLNMTELIALRTQLRLGTFSSLPHEGHIPKSELARKVNATESLIERQMRILVATGVIDQADIKGGAYGHTQFSRAFSDTTIPSPGTFYQAIPFSLYYGESGQNTWDVMATRPDIMRVFQISLKAMDQMIPAVGPFYDFSQFKATSPDDDRIQIVDVGGGYGKVLADIVTATPELDPKKCVLQDVERVIGISQDAQAVGIQTQVIDFFKEQPVKGAKAYYMRFITHDHSDDDVLKILTHVSDAMAPDSKLLFGDCVVPDRLVEATLPAGVLDQLMFCCGGKERTEQGFRDILAKVGLKLLKVHPIPGPSGAIVESGKIG